MTKPGMVTYSLAAPIATHRRSATCAEVECAAYINGFVVTIDPNMDLGNGYTGADQLAYLRDDRTRTHTETVRSDGVVEFTYPPGQPAFGPEHEHTLPLEREPFYIRRVNGRVFQHDRAEHWVEDLGQNQERLAKLIN